MSNYNNKHHDDGNPFYSEQINSNSPQQQQQQNLFTNTNIDFNDYSSQNKSPNPQYQPDLQFQSFTHDVDINNNTSPQNNSNSKIGGNQYADNVPLTSDESGSGEKKYSFYEIPYYRFLFNVDTKEVGFRLMRSMVPIKFSFFNLIRENPDLYGPFWVLTSLVFIVSVSSNLNDYFHTEKDYQVNIKKIVYSAIAMYGYSIIIPAILWGIFKWMNLGLRLLDMLCIYGYAMFIYIPASVLCVIPNTLIQWIIVAVAAVVSGVFLVTNIFTPLKEDFTKRGLIICAVIGGLHLGLALVLKLYFFANNTENFDLSSSSSGTPTPSVTTPPPTPSNS
ncbi:hypothetical protein DICPUDRAFT_51115 [Dictyostelium purpureum]|uniref:Protein YIPF n=1 Tax=Dictyostelium purpureum TaxID=5786 RepID=F1A252_DICPU|nr:uncharacterized protein DICPUDRAFT_51115 [Dictyostelium purpureum]EGC29720.1 hypothetical protein DICPUDRAFT_51115 [Dictyostelium purpureum]|eukprot:XP_003293746.1 hypothetical protein DICPUDRAFT_51115 [Dictyostelium purpureum]